MRRLDERRVNGELMVDFVQGIVRNVRVKNKSGLHCFFLFF